MNKYIQVIHVTDRSKFRIGIREYESYTVYNDMVKKAPEFDYNTYISEKSKVNKNLKLDGRLEVYDTDPELLELQKFKSAKVWRPNKSIHLDEYVIEYPSIILVTKESPNTFYIVKDLMRSDKVNEFLI